MGGVVVGLLISTGDPSAFFISSPHVRVASCPVCRRNRQNSLAASAALIVFCRRCQSLPAHFMVQVLGQAGVRDAGLFSLTTTSASVGLMKKNGGSRPVNPSLAFHSCGPRTDACHRKSVGGADDRKP
jgi:hypothetical protein